MSQGTRWSEAELAEAEARAKKAADAADVLARSGADLVRLTAEVRRLGQEIEAARKENTELGERLRDATSRVEPPPKPSAAPPKGAPDGLEAELGALMSAPFQVGPKAAAAAKSDPLAALAVQVARALAEDARDVERARLIAMAFAASHGDMAAFWAARRQRGGKKADSGERKPPKE